MPDNTVVSVYCFNSLLTGLICFRPQAFNLEFGNTNQCKQDWKKTQQKTATTAATKKQKKTTTGNQTKKQNRKRNYQRTNKMKSNIRRKTKSKETKKIYEIFP